MSPDSPPRPPPNDTPNNLPLQLTSFIGRQREIAEVKRLLTTTRLLTLTGAGGCGKTRLALHVAADVLNAYPDGVWLVELAALADPALVPRTAASVFGVPETPGLPVMDSLAAWLRPKTILMVLDNCEHVVGTAAQLVDALLRSCPSLRILATSREALGSAGETALRVPSLALPPPDGQLPVEQLLHYEAVRLFIERALAALPDFTVTDRSAPRIAEICRRLDGIPLAIELAAARVRVFSVEQIAARLDDRFRLLTTGQRTAMPRQQTLRAAVDWSYYLLSEPERALLRRLSVFAGGWTFEAAEAVGAGDGVQTYAVLDLLAQLVEKSLVLAEEQHGSVRYRLLETIRQYAREKLAEAGENARTRDRHLAYFLRLAEEAEPKLRGAEDRKAVEQLEEEHDNLRAALEWSLTPAQPAEAALRLSGALTWFWWRRGYHDEGCRWLARALAATPDPPAARMKALHGAGWLAHHRRDSATARELLRESLGIARELNDPWTVAWALHALGRVAYFDNDAATARALGEESLAMAEAVGDDWLIAWALHLLGLAAYIAADYPMARAYYMRSLVIRRQLGYQEGIGILLALMGLVALREGDLIQAHTLYREALAVVRTVLGPWGTSMPLASFAYIAAASGQPIQAAHLGAAAAALAETYHTPMILLFEPFLVEGLAIARQALGETAYAAAVQEGRAMSLDAVIAEAFAVEVAPPTAPPAAAPGSPKDAPFDGLTAAELQVLRLLAEGRTTREIAAELVLAVSTVDRHLTHIYQKLGVRNRAEATAFALKHGLA
jgi:predicted ATPase/DNA-binding CsgD family transcriptional regulator